MKTIYLLCKSTEYDSYVMRAYDDLDKLKRKMRSLAKEAEQEGCTDTYNEQYDMYKIRINFSGDIYRYYYTSTKLEETKERKLK